MDFRAQMLRHNVKHVDAKDIREEVGDLLFAALNIARYLQVDPETALTRANRKFSARFRTMEKHFASQGRALKEISVEEMETFWQNHKRLGEEHG